MVSEIRNGVLAPVEKGKELLNDNSTVLDLARSSAIVTIPPPNEHTGAVDLRLDPHQRTQNVIMPDYSFIKLT